MPVSCVRNDLLKILLLMDDRAKKYFSPSDAQLCCTYRG